eukprot:1023255-Pelagomonas_calceolata.AAC.3
MDVHRKLDDLIGSERFAPDMDQERQERVNELDMLRKYLAEATEAVDKCVTAALECMWHENQLPLISIGISPLA